jgi:Mlc titration factor MtfA (ptsG expression regulator)
MGLFVSPYGATSLEEYFANAFENFYLEDPDDVKKISPALYNLIVQLHQEEDN